MNIYLAGGESMWDLLAYAGHPNLFASFYKPYIAGKLITAVNGRYQIIVDSGAHSFFSQAENVKSASVVKGKKDARTDIVNLDKYIDEYCCFIRKFKHIVAYFVELDIDQIVGYAKVKEMREKLIEAGGNQIIVCYHPTMGKWEEVKDDLLQYGYIGVEGSDKKTPYRLNQYLKIIKDCYKQGIKVHGFAMTKKWFLARVPFYSVDSTSWRAAIQFGRSAIRATGMPNKFVKYESVQLKSKDKEVKYKVLQKEIDAWKKSEKYYTQYWEKRGIKWK